MESNGPDAAYKQYRQWINAPADTGDPEQQGERPRRTWQTVDSRALGKRLFIKRSGTEVENFDGSNKAGLPVNRRPRWKESLLNEVRAIEYVREHLPQIPVPTIICHFEDRGCYYVIEEYVEGAISAEAVPASHYPLVIQQLNAIVQQLRTHRRSRPQSFTGPLFLPARFGGIEDTFADANFVEEQDAFVLCHGDLAAHNVFVHPVTYKIVSIIDWEFASWLPEEVVEVWPRRGPVNPSLHDDPNDIDAVVNRLYHLTRPGAPTKAQRDAEHTVDPAWNSVIPGKPAWDQAILPKDTSTDEDR